MKRFLLISALLLLAMPTVFAVPALQLYIDGATYDDVTETWITSASSFDLYVIGKGDLINVTLSMALEGVAETDDPSGSGVNIEGTDLPVSNWVYGYAPLSNAPIVWDGGEDLPTHGIYPAWYTELGLGNFYAEGGIGDVNYDSAQASGDPYWLPTEGYISSNSYGWYQSYAVTISGPAAVHFDLFTLVDGEIDQFAPFSHDAGGQVPEPATMLLFGLGLAGAGVARKLRKK